MLSMKYASTYVHYPKSTHSLHKCHSKILSYIEFDA